jgi:equilibrative nucleoside transporter 1/2/3
MMALVGIGYLFPFNALTQPVDYWGELFPDFNIEFPLTSVYMYTNLATLAILVFVFPNHEKSEAAADAEEAGGASIFTKRIVGGFAGQMLVLIFVPTSYFFHASETMNEVLVLSATAFVAIVTAFLDSSVISLSAQYPLRVQESLQVGIGLSTLIGSVYRDITKLVFPPSAVIQSSFLYFYSGAATIAGCIAAYFILINLPLSKDCLEGKDRAGAAGNDSQDKLETDSLLESGSRAAAGVRPTTGSVLKKVLFNELMVLLLFISTLGLWPPLVTEMKSYNFPELQANGWWPLILLTVFSVLDCLGRLCVPYRMGLTKDNIWVPIFLRFGFFPLVICSVKGIFFTHDAWSILFVSGLGFTNGYVGTLAIVMVNECVKTREVRTRQNCRHPQKYKQRSLRLVFLFFFNDVPNA